MSTSEADMDKKLRRAKEILDLWFEPWGAAKAAKWEELTNDGPFSPEVAINKVREALR